MAGPLSPIQISAPGIDLSGRATRSATVVASPAASSETIIGSIAVVQNVVTSFGVLLLGFAAYTVGTDGTGVTLKLRKTDASGSTLKSTGILDLAATKLGAGSLVAVDTAPSLPGQVYVLTMTVTAGSAPSTVSAVELFALAI